MSSKKRPPKFNESIMSTKSNMNTTRRRGLDSTLSTTCTVSSGSVSHERSMQHKLDIAYSKYLQSLAYEKLLSRKNLAAEQLIDEQLTHHSEVLQNKLEETELLRSKIKYATEYKELLSKLMFVDEVLKSRVNDLPITTQIQQLTQQLQVVCDKLYLEGVRLEQGDVSQKLADVVGKLLEVSEEIKKGTNEEYFNFIDNVRQIEELSKKIKHVQGNTNQTQNIVNRLVLKVASMELSRDIEKSVD